MDPYLEHPDFWSEVHSRLIVGIADYLVPHIRPKYRVAIEKRIYYINPADRDDVLLVGIPDVTVKRQVSDPDIENLSNVAVLQPVTQPIRVKLPIPEAIQQRYLEVREMSSDRAIAALEILSPVNKRKGEGRDIYLQKRQQILTSLTHFIEIDLLRNWQPMPLLGNSVDRAYRILVSRSSDRPQADLYSLQLCDRLPCFALPLQPEDREPIIDLQAIFNDIYDRGGYDYIIDYTQDLVPPLSEAESRWVEEILQ
jgi:hypothetical protein